MSANGRAQRMAAATARPAIDLRASGDAARGGEIVAAGVRLPRAGDVEVVVDGRVVRLTNLNRLLWPEAGFTKAEAIAYWLGVAEALLPEIADAPLTVGRFPAGVEGRGFAQIEIPGTPEWVTTTPLVLASGATKRAVVARDRATLVWLAQMGVVELHTFLGRLPDLDRPRSLVLDLDPGEPAGLLQAAEVAALARERLAARGIDARVKTSGSAGMHVLADAPGGASSTFERTRALARAVADELVAARPDLVVAAMDRAARRGKVFVDVRQNARRLTTAAAYSLRSASWPTVSTPVAWSEVDAAIAARASHGLVFFAWDVLERVGDRDLASALRRAWRS